MQLERNAIPLEENLIGAPPATFAAFEPQIKASDHRSNFGTPDESPQNRRVRLENPKSIGGFNVSLAEQYRRQLT